eukprot:87289_1
MNLLTHLICLLCSFHLLEGSIWNLYGSNGDTNCSDATINDTCILHCDQQTPKEPQFDCGMAGDCYFFCEAVQCLKNSILNAQSAITFHAYSSALLCYQDANIYTAIRSSFESNGINAGGFSGINIHGNVHTQSIFINCTSTAPLPCDKMIIEARDVSALEIVGQSPGSITHSTIYCPQNSNYNGPRIAPCIFDFSTGGTIENINIDTLNGIPVDVMVYGVLKGSINIWCTAGSTTNIDQSFQNIGDCWITASPTLSPSKWQIATPSNNPTMHPTSRIHRPSTTRSPSHSNDDTINNLLTTNNIKLAVVVVLFIVICIVLILLCDVQRRKKRLKRRETSSHVFGSSMSMENNHMKKTQWTHNKMRIQLPQLGAPNALQMHPKHSGSLSKSLKKVAQKLENLGHSEMSNPDHFVHILPNGDDAHIPGILAPNARVDTLHTEVSLNHDPSVPIAYRETQTDRQTQGETHVNVVIETIELGKIANACSRPTSTGNTAITTGTHEWNDNAASEMSPTHSATRTHDRTFMNDTQENEAHILFELNPLKESEETRRDIATYSRDGNEDEDEDVIIWSMTKNTTWTDH